jgi:hypothetical protein
VADKARRPDELDPEVVSALAADGLVELRGGAVSLPQ